MLPFLPCTGVSGAQVLARYLSDNPTREFDGFRASKLIPCAVRYSVIIF